MNSFYAGTDEVAILRERIAELARIRQGFATHLGSSLYEATKDDEELRWGRESLYEGIATCDAERQRLLERIAALQAGPQPEQTPAADAQQPDEQQPEEADEPISLDETPAPDDAPLVEFAFDFEDAEQVSAEQVSAEPEIDEAACACDPDDQKDAPEAQEVALEPEEALAEAAPDAAPAPFEVELTPTVAEAWYAVADVDEEQPDAADQAEEPHVVVVDEPAPQQEPLDAQAEAAIEPDDTPDAQATASAEPVCPVCGSPVDARDRYCLVCGSELAKDGSANVRRTYDLPLTLEPEPEVEPKSTSSSASHVAEAPASPEDGAVDEQVPVCKVCGTVAASGQRFCMVCGASLEPTPKPEPKEREPKAGVCPECGAPTDPSFKFCMSCGHRL